jgi:ribosomal protein S12 methylthiotransferase accessory factor
MIAFPGGKKVNAEVNGMVIQTDQPKLQGGDGTAPSPFVLFLVSIGTCAGIYVLSFCQERKIPINKISLHQHLEYKTSQDGKSQELSKIILKINVPSDFPTKYYNTLEKVADQCAVKRTIMNPPQFEVNSLCSFSPTRH